MNDDDFSVLITNYFKNDYRERGLKKWRGFFLSDHTSALKGMNNTNKFTEKKMPQMSIDNILKNAMYSMANYYTVTIQLDETNFNHETKKNLTGSIENISDNYIFIQNQKIHIQTIRNLSINK